MNLWVICRVRETMDEGVAAVDVVEAAEAQPTGVEVPSVKRLILLWPWPKQPQVTAPQPSNSHK